MTIETKAYSYTSTQIVTIRNLQLFLLDVSQWVQKERSSNSCFYVLFVTLWWWSSQPLSFVFFIQIHHKKLFIPCFITDSWRWHVNLPGQVFWTCPDCRKMLIPFDLRKIDCLSSPELKERKVGITIFVTVTWCSLISL